MIILEYSAYQEDLISWFSARQGRIPSNILFMRFERLVDRLEPNESIDPRIIDIWGTHKEEYRHFTADFEKIDERLQSCKIDKAVYELDFKTDSKVTFLLGAGASAPSGIPTVDKLLTALFEKSKKLNRDDLDKLAEFCEDNEIKNIEDLLTAAYFSDFAAKKNNVISLLNYFLFSDKNDDSKFSRRRQGSNVDTSSISFLQDTLQTLFGLLTSTMINAKPNPAHYAIAKFVSKYKNTAIITTNYDCCVDEALLSNAIKIKESIELDANKNSEEGIELVKMHGSINWAYCESCQRTREFDLLEMKKIYLKDIVSYPVIGICFDCTGQRRPLLVPPLSFKFMMFPALIQLWNSAQTNIENAKYLIVIGYSFSDADSHITKIISRSMSTHPGQKMIVVTQDSKLVKSLRNKFSVSIERFDESRILEACESCEDILPKILKQNSQTIKTN